MNDLFVVDASVAVAWFVPQEQTNEALDFEYNNSNLFAPYLILLEVSNALLKHVRAGIMPENSYHEVIDTELPNTINYRDDFVSLMPGASAIAMNHGGTIYDAYYIFFAQQLNASLVTADSEQTKVARRMGVATRFIAKRT